jgi:spermidine synthase
MASGAAGLMYQVVWTRDLVLIFGNTTQAIVTTVTAFLAGLGIGSLIGGAIGPRLRRPLTVYGGLEIAVGCFALLMPFAFNAIATAFRSAYLSLPSQEVALIRFGLAFLALIPVTLIMGTTLPVLTRHLVRSDPDVGERIARLYGLNTLGAVVGTVASGFLLIELIGLRETTFVAVGLNVLAGTGALLISRGRSVARQERTEVAKGSIHLGSRQVLLLGVTFVSGLVSLSMEVLWTRILLQATGSSIYIFVAVLAVFLMGIALGSLVYERHKSRIPRITTLGVCLGGAAALTLVPVIVSNLDGPSSLPVVVLLIFPVTGLLGYAFPLTVRLFVESADQASRGVGLLYAANTAGCVVGTVVAGFVLIPTLGTLTSIVLLCLLEGVVGAGLAIFFAHNLRAVRAVLGICLCGALVVMFFVPAVKLTYTQREASGVRHKAHFDDDVASVDVIGGAPKQRELLINGYGITSLTIDTKLLAYLPKVLRPQASSMLTVCFGMGTTYRSSIILGMDTTAVELDPTVPTLMPWFYSDANKYLHNPLGHIVISDGRNYVRLTNKHFDLITADFPPPVWSAGAVVLMTQEFYQEAKARLNPGGIITVFIPYTPTPEQQLFLRTFRSAFPYMTVIRGPRPYGMYLLGSDQPMIFQSSSIEKIFGSPAAQADLANAPDYPRVPVTSWPRIISSLTWMQNGQVNTYTGPGPLLTDDHPNSEYFLLQGASWKSGYVSFEQPAFKLALAVGGLLVVLVVIVAADALFFRRRVPTASSPEALRVREGVSAL